MNFLDIHSLATPPSPPPIIAALSLELFNCIDDYSNKKDGKGIFGRAKIKDIKELKEEGINTQVLPWFQDKEN